MAHELYTNESGETSFGFVGDRSAIWHGLGQQLNQDSSISDWVQQAGFDWDVVETPVAYKGIDGQYRDSEEKKVLFRGDTGAELSVVGMGYKVVQPKEILEFFSDIVNGTDLYLDTAGILFGGRRFFANANAAKSAYVGVKEDTICGNILLVTSVDGTLASQAGFYSQRTVCNNTLRIALSEESTNRVRVTHRQVFDPTVIKQKLGLIDNAWGQFVEDANLLASKKISDADVSAFVQTLVYADPAKPTPQQVTQHNTIMDLYKNGMGASMTIGNMYGALNAVTEYADHHNRIRSADNKVWAKFHGATDKMKQEAFDMLMAAV